MFRPNRKAGKQRRKRTWEKIFITQRLNYNLLSDKRIEITKDHLKNIISLKSLFFDPDFSPLSF